MIPSVFSSTLFKKPAPLATLCSAPVLNCSRSKTGEEVEISSSSGSASWSTTGTGVVISGSIGVEESSTTSSLICGCISGIWIGSVAWVSAWFTRGTFLKRSSASELASSSTSAGSGSSSGHSISGAVDTSGSSGKVSGCKGFWIGWASRRALKLKPSPWVVLITSMPPNNGTNPPRLAVSAVSFSD